MTKTVVQAETLRSLFPMDRCRELISQTLAETDAECVSQDEVFEMTSEEIAELQFVLKDPKLPEELSGHLQRVLSYVGKRASEFMPFPPEVQADRLKWELEFAAEEIHSSWLVVLFFACLEEGEGKPVRLNNSLMPSWEQQFYNGQEWDRALADSLSLTPERGRELLALYAANIISLLNNELLASPEGVLISSVGQWLIFAKDAQGFYVVLEEVQDSE